MAAEDWDTEQAYPGAGILSPLYAVPSDKKTVVSTVIACNQSDQDTTFRVAIAPNAEDDASKHYLYYDTEVGAHRSFAATIGLTLKAGTVVRVRSANGRVSFNLSRTEVDA